MNTDYELFPCPALEAALSLWEAQHGSVIPLTVVASGPMGRFLAPWVQRLNARDWLCFDNDLAPGQDVTSVGLDAVWEASLTPEGVAVLRECEGQNRVLEPAGRLSGLSTMAWPKRQGWEEEKAFSTAQRLSTNWEESAKPATRTRL